MKRQGWIGLAFNLMMFGGTAAVLNILFAHLPWPVFLQWSAVGWGTGMLVGMVGIWLIGRYQSWRGRVHAEREAHIQTTLAEWQSLRYTVPPDWQATLSKQNGGDDDTTQH